MPSEIEMLYADALEPADAVALARMLHVVWPRDSVTFEDRLTQIADQWVDYDGPELQRPRYFVIWDDERDGQPRSVRAMAHAAPRAIDTSAGRLTVLALARVCTDERLRGKGYGAEVVRAAFSLVDESVYPFALFQTTPPVRSFYERLGCCSIDNEVINSLDGDPQAHPFWNPVIMRYPAGDGWPVGTIDLLGPGY